MIHLTTKARTCTQCGLEYQPTSDGQKYCPVCRPEMKRKKKAEWVDRNPDYANQWGRKHPEQRKVLRKCWNEKNMDSIVAYTLAHPEQTAAIGRKSKAKRRALGFVPINQPFDGCEGHHLNQNDVIYIPKEMHRGTRHNLWTGRNMNQINALAMEWLGST